MKKYFYKIFFIILIIAVIFLTACGKEEKVSKIPPRKTIGISIASMEYVISPIIKEAMDDLKERNNVELIWLNAEEDEEKEKKNVEELLEKKVDIIIIQPVNSKKNQKISKIIEERKIPVIAMDRIIGNTKLTAYVTSDNFRVGTEQAKYMAEQMEGQGKILILKGDQDDNVAIEITAGNKDILRKNLKIDIIAEEWHKEWSAILAEDTVRKTLEEYPDLKGILANNSDLAMAAVKVLKEKNLTEKIITVGADASKEACLAIARGEHDADVDKMPYLLGLASFKIATSLARGEPWGYDKKIKNGEYDLPVKVTPIMLIDKYNLITMRDRWTELNRYIKNIK